MAFETIKLRDLMKITSVEKHCLMDYPIFDEGYRKPLNRKILSNYLMREIGQETPELFFHYMRVTMDNEMPLFNQLYLSERIKFDPLSTVDLSTISASQGESESEQDTRSSSTGEATNGSRTVSSDYPQTMLSGSKDYATGSTDVNANSEQVSVDAARGDSRTADNSSSESSVSGRSATGASLLAEYRSTFLNIDKRVIDSLAELFLLSQDDSTFLVNRQAYSYWSY